MMVTDKVRKVEMREKPRDLRHGGPATLPDPGVECSLSSLSEIAGWSDLAAWRPSMGRVLLVAVPGTRS
jgi:hypothetical protein